MSVTRKVKEFRRFGSLQQVRTRLKEASKHSLLVCYAIETFLL